jgi:osmotically-inducible protein OsmY
MHLIRGTMISIVVAGALFGFSTACSKRVSDETIVTDIQEKVAADPVTKDSKVKVAAKNGRVTLTGTAKTQGAQERLEQIAGDEPGTTDVNDQTTIP